MKAKRSKRKRIIVWSVVLLVLTALAAWAFYTGLVVRCYDIETEKLAEGQSVRLVSVADLHSCYYGDDQCDLLEKVAQAQPDVIVLPGDIIDDHNDEDGAVALLKGLQGIAPAYYVSGNHEYWSGECERMKDMIREYGVTVLENERDVICVNGVDLCICGIDDPEVMDYTDDEAILSLGEADALLERFNDLGDNAVNILLAHRPARFPVYQQYDFDIVFSGHAHGGQVRIPLLVNGLYGPDQGWFPKYGGGVYKENGMTMVLSRGLGQNRLPRIFNPPEVVVVDLTAKQ